MERDNILGDEYVKWEIFMWNCFTQLWCRTPHALVVPDSFYLSFVTVSNTKRMAHLKTITVFRATTSLTARSHTGTTADLQPIAVSSIAYKEALISRRSSWTETNPQSLPRTSVARDTTMSYGMINFSSLRGRGNNASSDRKHHSTFPWIGQSSWETRYY
jgi:hypothetical protein